MTEVAIRKGTREDCPVIHRLFKELMELESIVPDQTIDEAVILKDGFGERPYFETLLAEAKNSSGETEVAGFALFFYNFSVFAGRSVFMEALYVKPDHQRKGIGKLLWQSTVQVALDNDCGRCIFAAFGWNQKAVDFYKRCGAADFTADKDEHIFHMTKKAMMEFVST